MGNSTLKRSIVLPPGRKKFSIKSEWVWGYIFAAPTVIGILIFAIGPMLYSLYMSLMKWNGLVPPSFIGLDNFKELFADPKVGLEFINTMYFTAVTVPATLVLSILLANILNQKMAGVTTYRVIYFLPSVTMTAAIAIVWQWLFNSRLGLVNMFLGLLHLPRPMWLGDPHFLMPAIMIVSIWGGVGYNAVIFLAGLQGIPQVFYEAAVIDGATKWVKLTKITLPLLTPTTFFLLTMSIMGALKTFDIVYMFAGVSSGIQGVLLDATRTMVLGIYQNGFTYLRMGYASAEAVMMFALIMVITVVQFIFQGKWVHYE